MDFIKREQPLRLFRESLQRQGQRHLYDWDLLLIDEAHNVAPAGRKTYIRDSDRTRMVNTILDHFEHRLFLTATPHNGYTESFTALLEMLDPLRFSRGPFVDPEQVKVVMVRRLKDDIVDALGGRKFARRRVEPLWVEMADDERRLHDLLGRYTRSRLERVDFNKSLTIRFALTLLKKRLLSSPRAFALSLEVHRQTLGQAGEDAEESRPDEALAERLRQRAAEEWADDEAKARAEEDALQENSRFFRELSVDEQQWLTDLLQTARKLQDRPDRKADLLLEWIRANLCPNDIWNEERLQFQEDLAWLERKRDHLRERLTAEPERIEQRYTLRSVRLFPVGLLYLLPEGLI